MHMDSVVFFLHSWAFCFFSMANLKYLTYTPGGALLCRTSSFDITRRTHAVSVTHSNIAIKRRHIDRYMIQRNISLLLGSRRSENTRNHIHSQSYVRRHLPSLSLTLGPVHTRVHWLTHTHSATWIPQNRRLDEIRERGLIVWLSFFYQELMSYRYLSYYSYSCSF